MDLDVDLCADLYAGKALQRMVLYIEKADTTWAEMWTRWEVQPHSEFFLIGKQFGAVSCSRGVWCEQTPEREWVCGCCSIDTSDCSAGQNHSIDFSEEKKNQAVFEH